MKILHLLYSGLGGHGNVFFSMLAADKEHAFEYEALFNGIEDMRDEYKERCSAYGVKWNFIKKKAGLDVVFYKNLMATIKNSDADIIFLHGSTQVLWAKISIVLKKKKNTLIVRETQANKLKTKQDWFWLATALLLANRTIFLTEEYRSEVKKKFSWIFNKSRTSVIPNGIDLEQYKPYRELNAGTVVFGMQSRVVKIKDHVTLLHAFAILLKKNAGTGKKINLKIAGDGDCRPGLEQLARELAIEKEVEFTGMLTEQQLVQFLSGLDIYVHASYGETMSTALMQAMACGLPIIASDVPGINNMIQHGKTGLLVPVEDKEKMSAALQICLRDEKYRAELAENALKFARDNYSNQRMFEAYKTIFEKK